MEKTMSRPAAERGDETGERSIELPATPTSNRVLHEAIGHLYDELAIANERRENRDPRERRDGAVPDEVFARLEELYVATAEESISSVTVTYDLEE